ncbi:MAG: DDE-type integrase/transposase/recombinase [Candidatus Thiodiazotropha taylori]|nr:DDE-type integrase/transposase/recombinase [Candidatus Thiodiazotropha taylori]MCW4334701.1 RNase H-like domain-containing protein [Candidatus Thiodiazotropha endolucinida]
MAGYIGKIEPYDEGIEKWSSYQERLEEYFAVNEIANEKKVSALLTLLGGKTYSLLRNLTAPDRPSTKSYDDLTALLKNHLSPKPLIIAERFRFHKRNQHDGETVTQYLAELRKLAEYCNFGTNLNDSLRDRFVCGLRAENIQKRLLSEADLTLKKALDMGVAMETAAKDATELQSTQHEATVHKVSKGRRSELRLKQKSPKKPCYRCNGTNHTPDKCKFRDETCHACSKKGHIKRACLSKKQTEQKKKVHSVDRNDSDEDLYISTLSAECNSVKDRQSISDMIWITPRVNEQSFKMELDTGSAVSVISQSDYKTHFANIALNSTSVTLKTYSGEKVVPLGVLEVKVEYEGQTAMLNLYVVEKGGPALFGREWLQKIQLNWKDIKCLHQVSSNNQNSENLDKIFKRYSSVFQDGIGSVKGIKASLHLKPDVTPKLMKPRPVAYSLKPKIEAELDKLEKQGIIYRVDTSEWATPIVAIPKKDSSVRICGDFKVTLNPALQVDQYPLPKTEDIFSNLAGGEKFTKLDLRQAYLQLNLNEDSKPLLTINTHKGLYRYNRMVYGISPSIWQRTIDTILQGLPGVQCILDDMIITGRNDTEHFENLNKVLQRLEQYGLRVNMDKCSFMQERVTYCGHEIDKTGLWKMKDKVDAVLNAPVPQNVAQLRSLLGLVNYYNRYLPNLSTVIKPLNELLGKNRKWFWSDSCQKAFENVKKLITSEPVLTHYDPNAPVRLACDASPYGLGAVLSHVLADGSEKPIAFASRSLTKAERNYAQIDREAVAIFWAVKKFHAYLFGRKFMLLTDHQPLTSIFSPSKSIPVTTAARLQRYALFLSGFNYDIEYKSTKSHTNADGLSRLPVSSTNDDDDDDVTSAEDIFHISQIENLPVTHAVIRRETKRDRILSQVYEQVQNGWQYQSKDSLLAPFYNRRNEITIYQGCLLWGIRVIIPSKLQSKVLNLLHSTHPGIVRMKSLARSYVFWAGIDKDIENLVKQCSGCQKQQKEPTKAFLHPWEWPTSPWERVHIDFLGPFMNRMFFVMIDAHSKWPEVFVMKSTSAEKTVNIMRSVFARNGLCSQIVSDNGPQFVSDTFSNFMKNNGIVHLKSAAYHAATNGQAERFVQTFKNSMRAMKSEPSDINKKIANFLLSYRNTIHATTNETPAKLFLGRNLRTRLDLLKPDIRKSVKDSQMKTAFSSEKGRDREFKIGQSVITRDYRNKDKWVPGVIQDRTGPLMYKVDIGSSSLWRRHADQLRDSNLSLIPENQPEPVETPTFASKEQADVEQSEIKSPVEQAIPVIVTTPNSPHVAQQGRASVSSEKPVETGRRYPLRIRKPPKRLEL